MNIFKELKRILEDKNPPKLSCGNHGEIMWCYCGKCKPKYYELPDDLKELMATEIIKIYKDKQK